MNSGVRSLGIFVLVTYTIPIVLMMSILCETGPMVMVNAMVLPGVILPMVVAVTILPVAIVEAHWLMGMPSIPFMFGVTIVRTGP